MTGASVSVSFLPAMTRYYSLFRRLLSRESKGEEADEEEGSIHKDSSQQGESSGDTAPTWVLSHSLMLTLFCSDQTQNHDVI